MYFVYLEVIHIYIHMMAQYLDVWRLFKPNQPQTHSKSACQVILFFFFFGLVVLAVLNLNLKPINFPHNSVRDIFLGIQPLS